MIALWREEATAPSAVTCVTAYRYTWPGRPDLGTLCTLEPLRAPDAEMRGKVLRSQQETVTVELAPGCRVRRHSELLMVFAPGIGPGLLLRDALRMGLARILERKEDGTNDE